MADAEAQGYRVVAMYRDDGVSGTVPPRDRPGFRAAVEHAQRLGEGAELVLRDWPRFARMHPARAAQALHECPVHVHVTRDTPMPVQSLDDQGPVEAGMAFFLFFAPWQYQVASAKGTQNKMEQYHAKTWTPKAPMGRKRKVSDEELAQAFLWAIKSSPNKAAHDLSEKRGVHKVTDPAAIKKRRVGRVTLIDGWKRLGWTCPPNHTESDVQAAKALLGPVGNSDLSETVSDTQEPMPDGNRPVSDKAVDA